MMLIIITPANVLLSMVGYALFLFFAYFLYFDKEGLDNVK